MKRRIAKDCGRLLHRILHRFFEVFLGCRMVVLRGKARSVAQPCCRRMHRVRCHQFRLSAGTHILEQLPQRLQRYQSSGTGIRKNAGHSLCLQHKWRLVFVS